MYLENGAQEWTDYRYSVKFQLLGGRMVGVWFRGTYKEVKQAGQWVTGYYFTVNVPSDRAELWQLKTVEENPDDEDETVLYHFSNPTSLVETGVNVSKGKWHTLTVEVKGARIKCYVDDVLVIDHTDSVGSVFRKGAIGLYTYGKWDSAAGAAVVRFDDVLVEPLD
jgi:hypothetical protein